MAKFEKNRDHNIDPLFLKQNSVPELANRDLSWVVELLTHFSRDS
jgi:hypothetical protein